MDRIILDTSFIISCINKKIDFLAELGELLPGYEVVVPEEVLRELERVGEDKKAKFKDRETAKLGIKLLSKVKKIKLGKKYVDAGIVEHVREHNEDYVATIDKELKKQLKRVIIIRRRRVGLG